MATPSAIGNMPIRISQSPSVIASFPLDLSVTACYQHITHKGATQMTTVTLKKNPSPSFRHIRAYKNGAIIGGASFCDFRNEWQIDWTFSYDAPRIKDGPDAEKVMTYMRQFAQNA